MQILRYKKHFHKSIQNTEQEKKIHASFKT